jgi:hypothetical protein
MRFPGNGSPRTMAVAASLLAVAIAADFGMAFVRHGVVRDALGRPFVNVDACGASR